MPNRTSDGRFAPGGGSPNPGGRPKKEREAVEKCLAALDQSIDRLIELTGSADENVALKAIGMVLDRGLSRPTQNKNVNTTHDLGEGHIRALRELAAVRRLDRAQELKAIAAVDNEPMKVIEHQSAGDASKAAYAEAKRMDFPEEL